MRGFSDSIELFLYLSDPDLCAALEEHPEGRERHDFAVAALRIGALALRHARGYIEAESARGVGARLANEIRDALDEHQRVVALRVGTCLRGHFEERPGEASELTRMLAGCVGEASAALHETLSASVRREIASLRDAS